MADNLDARARLQLEVEGLDQAIRTMDRAIQAGGDVDKAWRDVQKTFAGVQKGAKGAGDAVKSAGSGAAGAAKGWDALDDKVRGVADAYKVAAREAAAAGKAAPDALSFANQRGVSEADISNYKTGQSASFFDATGIKDTAASLPRLRYALYDVATTAGVASTAISGLGVASVAAYASMESSFTSVERTLDGITDPTKVAALRQELVGLTRQIPLTFANVSEIATLGNQLGIASSDIAQFTETTAKFSAVTGLTAEASAQAFGSLGELLNVQARDYEALGSSIALVGRKSVATEAEIVAMTTRLAASATNAGFTAQQVIALSGAFASLRIAPERAQGVMEVYFNRLNTAIADGGPRLEAFARITGVAKDQVEQLVRSDPTAFFERLATGLGQMDQIAQTSALQELGLQGIRAGEVFGRVSANVEVFKSALADANQGWSEGTELADQYAKVVDDLASRWQIFLNAVMEAGAGLGKSLAPILGVVLNLLTTMLQGFSAIANNPVGSWFVGTAAVIGILIAAITGFVAVSALGVASMAAMRSALTELGFATGAGSISLRTLAGATTQVGTAMGFSAGAIRTFKVALASTGIGLAVVALGTLATGLWEAANASKGLSAELQPVAESLSRAIEEDTKAFNSTGVAIYTERLLGNAKGMRDATGAVRDYVGVQEDASGSVDRATESITNQTIALGENADAVLRKMLSENDAIKNIANDPALQARLESAGFNVGEWIAAGLSKSNGASAFIDQLLQKAEELRAKADADTGPSRGTSGQSEQALAWRNEAQELENLLGLLQPASAEIDSLRGASLEAANTSEFLGIAASGAADEVDGLADSLLTAQQAALATESRLYALGDSLGQNAGMWDIYSDGGRQNLNALYSTMEAIRSETASLGGDNAAVASQFQALYNALIAGGAATADQLAFLKAQISSLAGGASIVTPAARNFTSLFSGIQSGSQKAAKSLGSGGGGLAKQVKTLVDYANDLQGVFKRAFDFRFGNQQAFDQITSGWQKIADAADAAREAIEEHQRKLADLAADRAIKEYWLMVAENYGDELRAAKLRADLADISADMAKEQKGLTKAQDKASMSLVGNSEAALENRSEILGLVGDYQSYLQSLAASGASQAELQRQAAQLRAEFVNQAVSMGYNRIEVERYAKAFDDMGTIISKVPRNITVSFTGDAALQAINEFAAKAKTALGGVSAAIGSTFDDSALKKASRGYALQSQIAALDAQMKVYFAIGQVPLGVAIATQIAQLSQRLNSGNYWTGGYVGDGGKYEPRGTVHGGEFVFSKAATRTLGVNNLNYMHNMAKSGKGAGMVGLGAAGGIFELSPFDRALLQQIADRVGLSVSGLTFQAVTNGANANAAQRRSA